MVIGDPEVRSMKLLPLFPVVLLLGGCQSSVPDASRSVPFLSAADEPRVPEAKSVASRLTSEQALNIAINLAKEHDEQLENYGSPRVTFYPKSQHWGVYFPNKRPYTYGKPGTYDSMTMASIGRQL